MSKWGAMRLGIFALVAVSMSAKPVPIGTISSCSAATIQGISLVPGTTIFSGDTIEAGHGGSVWIAASGGAQVEVFENSSVRFEVKG